MMRYIWGFLVIAAAMETPAAEPLRLRVISFNIHHGEGVDGRLDLERIARVIDAERPDLVALQEVDMRTRRTGGIDQARVLGRLTNMNVAFGANLEFQGGQYGNALLSVYPIERQSNFPLPNEENVEQRGVLIAEVRIPRSSNTLMVLATHFDHRSDDRQRVRSSEAVNGLVEGSSRPALLMGDLNDTLGSETLRVLGNRWKPSSDTALATIPVVNPNRQIDFILFRPHDRWNVIETRVLDESVASDHRAILCVLELLPE